MISNQASPTQASDRHSSPKIETNTWAAFWSTLILFDRSKLTPIFALRNSFGVVTPLAIATAFGSPLSGVAMATGALNVSYSDGDDPYAQRARRMLLWSVLGGVAVFSGAVCGWNNASSVFLAMAWAFAAGLMLSFGPKIGDLGLNTLVTLVVFAARPMSLQEAVNAGLLVIAGGFIQMFFSLVLWPIRRRRPERRALSQLYQELADLARSPADPTQTKQDSDILMALGQDHTLDGERFRLLYDQAERIRLSLFVLDRLRTPAHNAACLNQVRQIAEKILLQISKILISGGRFNEKDSVFQDLQKLVDDVHGNEWYRSQDIAVHVIADVRSEIDAFAGRLRAAAQLAGRTTPEGLAEFNRREAAQPLKLRAEASLVTLRANLFLHSAIFRHALRLSICVGVGDALGRAIDWQRSYWIAMTIAVILKPDFTATFSRGVLRLMGTLAGLVLATGLFHFFPNGRSMEILLVGGFTYLLRYIGPANYGIFSASVSALVVLLIAMTGVSPGEVIVARGLNTTAGGLLALLAYAVWPTWEKTQVPEALAQMLDACRTYFQSVTTICWQPEPPVSILDRNRLDWRRARSQAEASIDRVVAEPMTPVDKVSNLTSVLASSHQLMHAMMALEAGFMRVYPECPPETFRAFSRDVEFTLYYLSASLRKSIAASKTLPKLRDDYNRLVQTEHLPDAFQFILLEADRVTDSLNTLREQVIRYLE